MSTEMRLARLGLLHLINDHKALKEALEARQREIIRKRESRRSGSLDQANSHDPSAHG
tara:strand:+ start:280 stop:453 length:174 start_codon:yes stop_codon:yes gene_type:complete